MSTLTASAAGDGTRAFQTPSIPGDASAEALIAARLERLPTSGWHFAIMALIGTASLFDAYDIGLISFVMPVLVSAWKLAPGQVGLVFSAGFAGLAIGAALFGWLAERYGRVPILTVTILMLAVCGVGCALSTNYETLVSFRFLQGIALGGELPIAVTYVTELMKSARRGQLTAMYQIAASLGFLAAAYGSYLIIPTFGWQAMFYIGAAPALLVLPIRRLVPESPRWLVRRGRVEEAERIVADIEGKFANVELPPLNVMPVHVPEKRVGGFVELFSPLYAKRTFVLWTVWIAASTISYGLLAWLPTILKTIYKLPLDQVLRFATITSIFGVVGAVLGIVLVDRIGRRKLFFAAFAITTVALLGVWYMSVGKEISPTVIVTLATIGFGAVGMCQVTLWGYTSESYPTRIRAFATGTASVAGRVATVIMPIAVGALLSSSGVNSIYLTFGLIALVTAAVVGLFAIETRGRRLEELSP